jgi:hypothetical protein
MKNFVRLILDFISRNSRSNMLQRIRYAEKLRFSDKYKDSKSLIPHEHQVFSQNGEDGSIREIFRRIGEDSRFFIEIGVGNGLENNTTFLLMQGWRGIWIEGSAKHCTSIRKTFKDEIASGQLILVESCVTAENVNALIAPYIGCEIDMFSLDIDRNTYHVWSALDTIKPKVSVIEYNPTFPADIVWSVHYDANLWWKGTSYYGGSLAALNILGTNKGEKLVGCDLTGTNAYFVRADLCGELFLEPGSAKHHYEPSRIFLQGRHTGHPRRYSDKNQ